MKAISIFIVFILASLSVYSSKQIEININAKNDLDQSMPNSLSFGISPKATDVLDPELGELMLPPIPFSGFYAAFEFIDSTQKNSDGSTYYDRIWTNKDIRHSPEDADNLYIRHKMIFRFGYGKKISLNWNKYLIPEWVDSLFIRDGFNGLVINCNMKELENLTWDNDGILELYIHAYYKLKTTSVSNLDNAELNIFPNPVNSLLNIKSDYPIDKIDIFDLYGREIHTDNKNIINLNNLSCGVYYIKIYSNSQFTLRKFIKN